MSKILLVFFLPTPTPAPLGLWRPYTTPFSAARHWYYLANTHSLSIYLHVCVYVLDTVYLCVVCASLSLRVCCYVCITHCCASLCVLTRVRCVARALSTYALFLLHAHCSHVCSMKNIILIIFSHICSIATILDRLDTLIKSPCRKISL